MEFSRPVLEYGWKDKAPVPYNGGYGKFRQYTDFPEMAGRKVAAWFKFDTTGDPELTVKVALSATGTTGALKNLRAEAEGVSFDVLRLRAEEAWERELACIDIDGTEAERPCFIPPCTTR